MPLETDLERGWLGRCVRTLGQLIISPSRSFRAVEEPVDHGRVLAFLALLRLSLWLVAMAWGGQGWALDDGPQGLDRPTVVGVLAGAQFADTLRLWLLMMVPLGLPMLYFFGGILGHLGLALTGGARRSIGASMRAFGLALAPALLLVGVLDVLLIGVGVEPEVWAVILVVAVVSSLWRLAFAFSRTHGTSLFRGLLVALLPALLFTSACIGRGLLELERLPFVEVEEDPDEYYIPEI